MASQEIMNGHDRMTWNCFCYGEGVSGIKWVCQTKKMFTDSKIVITSISHVLNQLIVMNSKHGTSFGHTGVDMLLLKVGPADALFN